MVYEIIFKKRFSNKLAKLLIYLENEFGLLVAQRFAQHLERKFDLLQQQPFTGTPSISFSNIRSILAGKHNRIYYRIQNNKVIIINMYDSRINPGKNKLK